MEEICLYRLCERDVSADNGVALDGWGTSPSPDDGDRLLSPNKESAFCKRSKREKKQYHQQQQQQQNFGTEQQQHQLSRHDNKSAKVCKKCVLNKCRKKTAFETKNSIYAISPEIIVFNPKLKRSVLGILS